MVQSVVERGTVAESSPARDLYIEAYRVMLLARVLDDKYASLFRSGRIPGGVFLGRGQEALSVAAGLHLRKGDIFAPLIRDAAGRLAFGETVLESVRTFLGSPLGMMRARDGNVHRGKPGMGYLPMISHLGTMISVVNGALLAHRFKGLPGTVGVASMGDGSTSTGAFHEGLNQAAVERLPLVLLVANNQYAYSTPNDRQFACQSLLDKAVGYGVMGFSVEGNDLEACLEIVGRAVRNARDGKGPQLVVARLLRLCGHGEHDDSYYISSHLKGTSFGRDCLKVAQEHLLREGWATAETLQDWRTQAVQTVLDTVAVVQREIAPDAARENWQAISSPRFIEGQNRQ